MSADQNQKTALSYTLDESSNAPKSCSASSCPVDLNALTGPATDFLISRILNLEKLIIHFNIALFLHTSTQDADEKEHANILVQAIFKQIGNMNDNNLLTSSTSNVNQALTISPANIVAFIPMDYNPDKPAASGLIFATSSSSVGLASACLPKTPAKLIFSGVSAGHDPVNSSPVFSFAAGSAGNGLLTTSNQSKDTLSAWTSNDLSISLWIKSNASTTASSIVTLTTGSTSKFNLSLSAGTSNITMTNSTTSPTTTTTAAVRPVAWNNIVVTNDYTGLKLYVNAVIQGIQKQMTSIDDANLSITIGSTSGSSFNGSMSALALYNVALGPADIVNEWSRVSPGISASVPKPSLMNGGMGKVVKDLLKKKGEFESSVSELHTMESAAQRNKTLLGKTINQSESRATTLAAVKSQSTWLIAAGAIIGAVALIAILAASLGLLSTKIRLFIGIFNLCICIALILIYVYVVNPA